MKVRYSQIDEVSNNSGKKKNKNRKATYPSKHKDSNIIQDEDEIEDEEEQPIKRMIYLPDFGISVSLWAIQSITKEQRFLDDYKNPRFQYGIVINRGVPLSDYHSIVDLETWFEDEETRDQRYNKLFENLRNIGYEIIEV